MIKQRVSRSCPHTRKANGVILMPTDMLAALSGAVKDRDEWAVVLQGIKSEDGYEITVNGWRLPEQERTGGHVDLSKDIIQTPLSNPPGNDVAVLHSHCDFGARFSQLDIDKLNTRYPASIVISQSKTELLGFAYQAVGKVTLPCGGKGEIAFYIQPMAEIELATVNRVTHNEADLGDCARYHNVAANPWQVQWRGECGLVEPAVAPKPYAFGATNDLLDVVAKLPREQDRKVVGFNSQETHNKRKKSEWICPSDKSELYWSLVKVGELYCDKCTSYFVPPDDAKQGAKQDSKTKPTTFVGENVFVTENMYLCEVCGKYDEFEDWDCGTCGDSTLCLACGVGHGEKSECHEEGAGVGLKWWAGV